MNKQFAFAGQADVYMRFLDPELDTGFFHAGDMNELKIKTETEKKTLPSNQKSRRGTLKVLEGKTTHSISMKSKYFDKRTFAMRAGGVIEEAELTAQPVTGESITIKKVGGMYPLENKNIDTSKTIAAKKGTTLLTDADYSIVNGMLLAKIGGALSDGDTVTIDYETKARKVTTIKGGKKNIFAIEVMLKGINVADDDSEFEMEIYRSELSSDDDFSYIGKEFGEASFSGEVILVDNKNEPFKYETFS